ncbi:type II secretion system minor pseudopilin GspH [Ketobacter sp.]|uniref:type II secretion system minor pseudopilin GspH n=1 Tax=Ketobacter sp. TaxID=2083498 RepID=UPI0025C6B081|nr:type II secretion system minor pseudopilin GspH [Ketobacter sp.]
MPRTLRHHHGFTLIEIMVVVTIIGIMTGLIAINVITQDPQKELNKEAMRFKALLEMAQEEALFSQQEIGVIVTEQGYKFARWSIPESGQSVLTETEMSKSTDDPADPSTAAALSAALGNANNKPDPSWNLISNEQAFREYELPEEYELILEVDHEQIDLTGGVDQEAREKAKEATKILEEEEEELKPSIFVMSSGELSPFVLEMVMREDSEVMAKVSGSEIGRIWIGDEDELEDR